jgi:carbonic anhydrase/acetyltransferase-like protein (isoleucine patch superfamily)
VTAIHPYRDTRPRVDPTAFIAPGARIVGDVTLGPETSVWFNAVIRADSDSITIGAGTNVQDCAVLHTDPGVPCEVGERCTIGHGAIVHACRIGRGCLIGMGAIVLTRAVIGDESLVAAGTIVPEGREFPARSLLLGAPARVVRSLSDEDVERLIRAGLGNYRRYVEGYRDAGLGQSSIEMSQDR